MPKNKQACFLGIEGGGTRSVAWLADGRGRPLARAEAGPCNVKHMSDAELRQRFCELARKLREKPETKLAAARPARVAICCAGCRSPRDAARVRRLAAAVWPSAKIIATDDLISGLLGGLGHPDGLLIISGTGSCVFAQRGHRRVKVGGWGNFLGDEGSGYQIALEGLRQMIRRFDRTGNLGELGRKIFARLGFLEPEDAVDWINRARKAEVAALANVIFDTQSDPLARPIISMAARQLAAQATLAAQRVGFTRRDRFEVCLSGGVFANQPKFFALLCGLLKQKFPRICATLPRDEGARGALQIALGTPPSAAQAGESRSEDTLADALTEQPNPRWPHLDRMSIPALLDAMLEDNEAVLPAVRVQRKAIAAAIQVLVRALKQGGRLFYVGAGTSGRLGVLDASECPPTFGVEPHLVQGIIAGGPAALAGSVEAAEDDPAAGAEALRLRRLTRRDVVCGISASGRTPFVLGALAYACKVGAKTVFLTMNPRAPRPNRKGSICIVVPTGPEFLTGSTRLKAGTATKLVLNMLTTVSMIRLGRVRGNLMSSVRPANVKLRERAVRIVMHLCGCSHAEAQQRLLRAGGRVQRAIARRKQF